MNLNDDIIFKQLLNEHSLSMEDYNFFLEHFGELCENPMPENLDLRKIFLLQSVIGKTINKLEMRKVDILEGLTEYCIAINS